MLRPRLIYHLTSRDAWEAAAAAGSYRTESLATEGFIHCSEREQVAGVAARYFRGRRDLVLLEIRPDLVAAPLRLEPPPGRDERFPHVYGPIEAAAVARRFELPPVTDRELALPAALERVPSVLPASPRLVFDSWKAADADLAAALWSDPRVMRFLCTGSAPTPADAAARLAREIESEERHGIQYWKLSQRGSGEPVGCCGLRPRELAEGIPELGFHLLPAAWGQGLAGEAARATLALAFRVLRAPAVFAGHHPENRASARVLAKLGFRHTHDELYPPTGLKHPSYQLEAAAWEAAAFP